MKISRTQQLGADTGSRDSVSLSGQFEEVQPTPGMSPRISKCTKETGCHKAGRAVGDVPTLTREVMTLSPADSSPPIHLSDQVGGRVIQSIG